jgi:hypothetical protein
MVMLDVNCGKKDYRVVVVVVVVLACSTTIT